MTAEASGCYYWQRGNFCLSCSQPWTHLEMHWIEANAWLFYSMEHKRLGGCCLTDSSLLLLQRKRLSEQDVKSSILILFLYSSRGLREHQHFASSEFNPQFILSSKGLDPPENKIKHQPSIGKGLLCQNIKMPWQKYKVSIFNTWLFIHKGNKKPPLVEITLPRSESMITVKSKKEKKPTIRSSKLSLNSCKCFCSVQL